MTASPAPPADDQNLLDKIVYLAGMVSQPQAIDPLLDRVRRVTAQMTPGTALTPQSRADLEMTYQAIEEYLINDEPLRSFTKESLESQTQRYLEIGTKGGLERKIRRQVFLIVGGVIVVNLTAHGLAQAFWPKQVLTISMMPTILTLYIGLNWLFLSSLKTFVPKLRQAYSWICAGLMGIGVGAALWVAYSSVPSVYHLPIFRHGLSMYVIAASYCISYVGLRKLARVLGKRSILLNWPLLVVGVGICCLGVLLIPHGDVPDAQYLDWLNLPQGVVIFLGIGISILAFSIQRNITTMYASALRWVGAAYVYATLTTIVGVVILLMTGLEPGGRLSFVSGIVSGATIMMLTAGYKFKVSAGKI